MQSSAVSRHVDCARACGCAGGAAWLVCFRVWWSGSVWGGQGRVGVRVGGELVGDGMGWDGLGRGVLGWCIVGRGGLGFAAFCMLRCCMSPGSVACGFDVEVGLRVGMVMPRCPMVLVDVAVLFWRSVIQPRSLCGSMGASLAVWVVRCNCLFGGVPSCEVSTGNHLGVAVPHRSA